MYCRQRPNLIQLSFFSYLLGTLLLFMLPHNDSFLRQLLVALAPACCALALLGRWLMINVRACVVVAMLSLAYLHQQPVQQLEHAQLHPVHFVATIEAYTCFDDYVTYTLRDLKCITSLDSLNGINTIRAINKQLCEEIKIGDIVKGHGVLEKKGRWLSIKKFSYSSLGQNQLLPFCMLRHWVQTKLSSLFNGNELGIARALILADKSSLDDVLQSGYRNFGLLHLLAVSGMHFWLWNLFLRRLLGYRFNRWRLPLLILAAALAGFGPAVSRALGFIVVRDIAAVHCRSFSALQLLSVVGLGELLLFQNSYAGLGYVLSYCATIAIIVCSDREGDSSLQATLRCSWAAFFATMPIIHSIQATIELFSIVFSPIFAVFTTARLFIILCSLALPTQPISQWLLSKISLVENKLISICDLLPGTPMIASTSSQVLVTLSALTALCLAAPFLTPNKRRLRAVMLLLVIVLLSYKSPNKIGISMINVGHGLGVVINGEQRTIGFDIGSKTIGPNRLIDGVYFKELQNNKWQAPNEFIFSHNDADHVNGLPALIRRLDARELSHQEIMSLQIPPWETTAYRTKGDLNSTSNDNGYALDMRYKQQRIIVLGDQDGTALFDLAQRIPKGPVSVLFSPHHGLSTDGLAMLLEHLQPAELWTSCAPDNFPLPAQEIAQFYGVPLLHTAAAPLRIIF